jgi:hypothetical protein
MVAVRAWYRSEIKNIERFANGSCHLLSVDPEERTSKLTRFTHTHTSMGKGVCEFVRSSLVSSEEYKCVPIPERGL